MIYLFKVNNFPAYKYSEQEAKQRRNIPSHMVSQNYWQTTQPPTTKDARFQQAVSFQGG